MELLKIVLLCVMIVLLLVFIFLWIKYILVAQNVKANLKLAELYKDYIANARLYLKTYDEMTALQDKLNKALNGMVVECKEYTKQEADEKMELMYLETPSGFHIGLDFTYIDQVGDFKIILPTGEAIDTATIDPETTEEDEKPEA